MYDGVLLTPGIKIKARTSKTSKRVKVVEKRNKQKEESRLGD